MKVLTHNFLSSAFLKGVKTGYPLQLRVTDKTVNESELNAALLKNTLAKVEYDALRLAAEALEASEGLPAEINQYEKLSEDEIQALWKLLFCVEIVSGVLICPETGREFPICDGIPNMLANEDEV